MAMSIPSFDYAGLSYIVREFDRKHALLPSPEAQKRRAIVIHELQRHFLSNGLPIEIIHRIFHYHLKNTRSVSEFILCYRGSPAINDKLAKFQLRAAINPLQKAAAAMRQRVGTWKSSSTASGGGGGQVGGWPGPDRRAPGRRNFTDRTVECERLFRYFRRYETSAFRS